MPNYTTIIIFNLRQLLKACRQLEEITLKIEQINTESTNYNPLFFNKKLYKEYIEILEIVHYFQENLFIDPFRCFEIRQKIRSKILKKQILGTKTNENYFETGRGDKIKVSRCY